MKNKNVKKGVDDNVNDKANDNVKDADENVNIFNVAENQTHKIYTLISENVNENVK